MIKKLFISTAICGALISSPVFATGSGTTADNQGMDTTSQEYSSQDTTSGQVGDQQNLQAGQTGQTRNFDEMDRDGDGELTEEELNIYGSTAAGTTQSGSNQDRGERMLEKYDENNDGALSEDEYKQGAKSMGHQQDKESNW
jgi:Ca2+-binding EF-hand superfamily protein